MTVTFGQARRRRRRPDLRRAELLVRALLQRPGQACAGDRRLLADAVGPSEATNATSNSPAAAVLKAGVMTVSLPSTETTVSTVDARRGGTGRDDERDGAAAGRLRAAGGDLADDETRRHGRARRGRDRADGESCAVMAFDAAVCVRPTTFGTDDRRRGPDETTSATALPAATCVPAIGFWLMTLPAGTVALDARGDRADDEAGAGDRGGRGGLRRVHDVRHGDRRRTRRHDQRNRAAGRDLRAGRRVLADDRACRHGGARRLS